MTYIFGATLFYTPGGSQEMYHRDIQNDMLLNLRLLIFSDGNVWMIECLDQSHQKPLERHTHPPGRTDIIAAIHLIKYRMSICLIWAFCERQCTLASDSRLEYFMLSRYFSQFSLRDNGCHAHFGTNIARIIRNIRTATHAAVVRNDMLVLFRFTRRKLNKIVTLPLIWIQHWGQVSCTSLIIIYRGDRWIHLKSIFMYAD